MVISLGYFIGLRFKQARRKSGFVSLISLISTLSIALGMIVLIVGLSAMNGFERELKQRVLALVPHANFYPKNGSLANWQVISNQFMSNKHIIAVEPYINFTGLLENGEKLSAVVIKGIESKIKTENNPLSRFVEGDGWKRFAHQYNSIIIGKGLATDLNIEVGQWITLIVPRMNSHHQLQLPKRVKVQIVGILTLAGNLGHRFALIPLPAAQRYTHIGDSVTGLMVNFDNVFDARRLATEASRKINISLNMSSWQDEYGYMYHDIQMIRSIMYLAMVLVIGISCFSIVSTLVIVVKDRQTDIAVLKTLGATTWLIQTIFLFYGAVTSVVGSVIGVSIGTLVALNLSSIVNAVESAIGHKFLDDHIYFIDFIPSELHLTDVIATVLLTMLLSLIASYYPAKRACKIDPAQVLRHH